MRCDICGNAAQLKRDHGDLEFIHLYQCNACKCLVCSECTVVGRHEKELDDLMKSKGVELKARYCPKCNTKLGAAVA